MDIFEHVPRTDGFSDLQNSLSATRSQGEPDRKGQICSMHLASSDGYVGSVQPAADAHFRLTSKKNEYPEAWLFHFPVLCEAGFRR